MTQRSMIRSIPSHRPTVSVEPVAGVEAHAQATERSLTSLMLNAVDQLVRLRGVDVVMARVLVEDQVARGLVQEWMTAHELADQVEEWCQPIGWAAGVSKRFLGQEVDQRHARQQLTRVRRVVAT